MRPGRDRGIARTSITLAATDRGPARSGPIRSRYHARDFRKHDIQPDACAERRSTGGFEPDPSPFRSVGTGWKGADWSAIRPVVPTYTDVHRCGIRSSANDRLVTRGATSEAVANEKEVSQQLAKTDCLRAGRPTPRHSEATTSSSSVSTEAVAVSAACSSSSSDGGGGDSDGRDSYSGLPLSSSPAHASYALPLPYGYASGDLPPVSSAESRSFIALRERREKSACLRETGASRSDWYRYGVLSTFGSWKKDTGKGRRPACQ
jgi:hypothetical protein